MGYWPPKNSNPTVLKIFNPPPPSPQTFYSPLWLEMTASAFFTHGYFQHTHVHISEAYFYWSLLLLLIKCCHNWFLKKLEQYIKETRSYHYPFLFFICDDLSFVNITKKSLKPSKKMSQCPGRMRKKSISGNFSWRVAAETWDASCFKKGLLEKQQSVPNTCAMLSLKKMFIRT